MENILDKLHVYGRRWADGNSALNYYRVKIPLTHLKKLGLAETFYDEGTNKDVTNYTLLGSDVFSMYRMEGDNALHITRVLKEMQSGLNPNGQPVHPPVICYDLDDNIDYVHPYNEIAYVFYGIRDYPTGELLSPGDTIVTTDEEGKEKILWEDKVTMLDTITWSIEDCYKRLKSIQDTIKLAHGCTVCSAEHVKYVKNVLGQPNVYQFPNTVVFEDYDELPIKDHEGVRILWQGGSSHLIDWWPLRFAVKAVAEKYPNVKWVIWGQPFDWILDVIPKSQLEYVPWVDYGGYKVKRLNLGIDINLCPLANNPFNWCKSCCKWYEGSVSSTKPEATLASDTKPYNQEIIDGVSGLLFKTPEEFVEKLSILIENAELRKKLGHNAHQWIKDNRTPEKTLPGLLDFYNELKMIRVHEWLTRGGASSSEIKRLASAQGLR